MKDLLAKYRGNPSSGAQTIPLVSPGAHSSVQAQIYARLREAILDGNLEPGQRLLQDELAAELAVSRMPVREALLRLEADGLVNFHPYKGFTVVTFTQDDLKEIYFLRGVLEGTAAELAAININEADLGKIDKLCQRMAQSFENGQYDEMPHLNAEFHQSVYLAACSLRLYKMIVRLWNSFPKSNMDVFKERAQLMVKEHTAIYEALRDHDSQLAGNLTRQHIANALAALEPYWSSRLRDQRVTGEA